MMVFEVLAGCVRERKRYQNINNNDTQINPKRIQQKMNKSIEFAVNKNKPNRALERVRFAAEGPLQKVEKTFQFGREQVITHASRREFLANF